MARDGRATSEMVNAASSSAVAAAAKRSHCVARRGQGGGRVRRLRARCVPLDDYGDQQNAVLVAAVPALMVAIRN